MATRVALGRRDSWRFIFTDLSSVITTWAYGIQTARAITFTLGQSTAMEGAVDPDDFRVNGLWTDGYPRVAPLKRLVYAFRREGGGTPWVIRNAGLIMAPNDEGSEDSVLSHWAAYDARKLLEARPARRYTTGELPGPNGFRTGAQDGSGGWLRGNEIVLIYLKSTIAWDGPVRIDAGTANGGTSYYGSTGASIDATDFLDLTIANGQSVEDVWKAVEDTGTCEIRLNPIYDPINRPGYTHELAIHKQVGVDRYSAVFGWDILNRALGDIQRVQDATPGNFFNIVDYFAGMGGNPPVIAAGALTDPLSIADFGRYWSLQFYPAMQTSVSDAVAIFALAKQALVLNKQGKRTLTLKVVPQRGPRPLIDYREGDRVMVHATKRLRAPSNGLQRVQAIPIQITDDGLETVSALLVSPNYLNLTPDAPGQQTIMTSLSAITTVETRRATFLAGTTTTAPFRGPH